MDHFEIAREFATVLGRPVDYEPIAYDDFAQRLSAAGYGAHLIQHLRHVAQDYQRGAFAGTNDVVERVGHKAPITVTEFIERHRDSYQAAATTTS